MNNKYEVAFLWLETNLHIYSSKISEFYIDVCVRVCFGFLFFMLAHFLMSVCLPWSSSSIFLCARLWFDRDYYTSIIGVVGRVGRGSYLQWRWESLLTIFPFTALKCQNIQYYAFRWAIVYGFAEESYLRANGYQRVARLAETLIHASHVQRIRLLRHNRTPLI